MPISIHQMGPTSKAEGRDPGGWRNYDVAINGTSIASFKHKRADGLAMCLRKAANAVDATGRPKTEGIIYPEKFVSELWCEPYEPNKRKT